MMYQFYVDNNLSFTARVSLHLILMHAITEAENVGWEDGRVSILTILEGQWVTVNAMGCVGKGKRTHPLQ